MINNGWYLRIFKNTYTKEIDGKKYLCIESYSNRLRKTQKEVADELRNITKLYLKIRKENNK